MLTNQLAKSMRAEFEDSLDTYLSRYKPPYISSHKIDGDGIFILIDEGKVTIVNRGATVYSDVAPALSTGVALAVKAKALLLGELYADEGKHGDLYKIRTYLANNQIDKLKIAVFDILELNSQDFKHYGYETRYDKLRFTIKPNSLVYVPNITVCQTKEEILQFKDQTVKEGYEGIVVKSFDSPYLDHAMLRLKAKAEADVVILGITKTDHYRKSGVASSFLIGFFNQETKTYKQFGRVGSGLDWQTRAELTSLLEATRVSEDDNFVYIRPLVVVTVEYEKMLEDSFRSPRITKIRTDKTVLECASKPLQV